MTSSNYPTFSICNIVAANTGNNLLNADRIAVYRERNPHLTVVHRHTFFHFVYFTKGGGSHTIDFENFTVERGSIYFMRPGQVHQWFFDEDVDGYVINFSLDFFDKLLISSVMLEQFVFFTGNVQEQIMTLPQGMQVDIEELLNKIVLERAKDTNDARLMIAGLLIQLFVQVRRVQVNMQQQVKSGAGYYNEILLRHFRELVEKQFYQLRLPKEYAALLFVTPAHLNHVCKEVVGVSAGEIIRKRIILEAKRLLIDAGLSVNAIALELNFTDTSNFVKFFKKYTGYTPDAFRNGQLNR